MRAIVAAGCGRRRSTYIRKSGDRIFLEATYIMRAVEVSHTACKYEFRQNLRSHSWSVFHFYIIPPPPTRATKNQKTKPKRKQNGVRRSGANTNTHTVPRILCYADGAPQVQEAYCEQASFEPHAGDFLAILPMMLFTCPSSAFGSIC